MRSLLLVASPLIVAFTLIGGALELWSSLRQAAAAEAFQNYRDAVSIAQGAASPQSAETSSKGASRVRALKFEQLSALDSIEKAASLPTSSFRTEAQRASFLRLWAEQESDPQARVEKFCDALAGFGEALRVRPSDAQVLMSWANLRQLLGSVDCQRPYTTGDYQGAIVAALKSDPSNIDTRYAAGLILLWGEERPAAYKLFHHVLRYGTNITSRQLRAILRQVTDAKALVAIVPPRFPQVLQASRFFEDAGLISDQALSSDTPGAPGSQEFRTALRRLQLQAIRESVERFERDEVPFDLHFSRLRSLVELAATDDTRALLDRELSELVRQRGYRQLAEYLRERSEFRGLEFVSSTVGGDTRPLKNPLTRWGTRETVVLDEFYRSIGFFLGAGQSVRAIEFLVRSPPSNSAMNAFKVFVSDDNVNWEEITAHTKFSRFEFGNQWLVAARTSQGSHRYWKISFGSASRDKQLHVDVPDGVRIYGTSIR